MANEKVTFQQVEILPKSNLVKGCIYFEKSTGKIYIAQDNTTAVPYGKDLEVIDCQLQGTISSSKLELSEDYNITGIEDKFTPGVYILHFSSIDSNLNESERYGILSISKIANDSNPGSCLVIQNVNYNTFNYNLFIYRSGSITTGTPAEWTPWDITTSYTKSMDKNRYSAGDNISISTDNKISAIGYTYDSNDLSFAECDTNLATGLLSHAEGYNTLASGTRSHAEGYNTIAKGSYSHVEGYNTTSSEFSYYQHVQGQYNEDIVTAADIIGWGTSSKKKNIEVTNVVNSEGVKWLSGDITCGGTYTNPEHKLSEKISMDDLEIGGINLIVDSKCDKKIPTLSTTGGYSVAYSGGRIGLGISDEVLYNGNPTLKLFVGTYNGDPYDTSQRYIQFDKYTRTDNKLERSDYIVSCMVYIPNDYPDSYVSGGNTIYSKDKIVLWGFNGSSDEYHECYVDWTKKGQWQKLTVYLPYERDTTQDWCFFRIADKNYISVAGKPELNRIYISEIQFVKGNKETNWRPSPEEKINSAIERTSDSYILGVPSDTLNQANYSTVVKALSDNKIQAAGFKTPSGTPSQILMADGSVTTGGTTGQYLQKTANGVQWATVSGGGGGSAITYSLSKTGSTIKLTGSDGSSSSVTDSDTKYSNATTTTPGLMSSDDKTRLNTLTDTYIVTLIWNYLRTMGIQLGSGPTTPGIIQTNQMVQANQSIYYGG